MKKAVNTTIFLIIAMILCSCRENDVSTTSNEVETFEVNNLNATNEQLALEQNEEETKKSDEQLDLTIMDSDMVYATVFQFMNTPNEFLGKRIKLHGVYNCAYYEATQKTYHSVIIKDAMQCCSNGVEFILKDEEGYPKQDTEITIEGTFSTYEEDGGMYCTLADAIICD